MGRPKWVRILMSTAHCFLFCILLPTVMKEIQLYQVGYVMQTVDHHNNDYITALHLTGWLEYLQPCTTHTDSAAVQLIECILLSDYYNSHCQYFKAEFKSKSKFKFSNFNVPNHYFRCYCSQYYLYLFVLCCRSIICRIDIDVWWTKTPGV